jgi:ParB/RepB/Spo0J family partition protein
MAKANLQLVPPAKQAGKGKKPAAAAPVVSQDFKKQIGRLFKSETPTGWPEGPVWVNVDLLHDNPFQKIARPTGHAPEKIEEMRNSLDRLGQLQDALGRPHKTIPGAIELAFAHGRREGVKAGGNAGSPKLAPAERAKFAGKLRVVVGDFTDEEMLELLSVENDIRTDTNPISRARLYLKLYELTATTGQEVTWEEVAAKHKLSYRQVRRYVALLDLPRVVQRAIQRGEVQMAVAPALLLLRDEQQPGRWTPKMKALFRAVLRDKLSGPKAMERAQMLVGAVQGSLDLEEAPTNSTPTGQGAGTGNAPGLQLVPGGGASATAAAAVTVNTGASAPASADVGTRTRSTVATMDRLPDLVLSQLQTSVTYVQEAAKGVKRLELGTEDREKMRATVEQAKRSLSQIEKMLGKGQVK